MTTTDVVAFLVCLAAVVIGLVTLGYELAYLIFG
jgi:hypothetical protein